VRVQKYHKYVSCISTSGIFRLVFNAWNSLVGHSGCAPGPRSWFADSSARWLCTSEGVNEKVTAYVQVSFPTICSFTRVDPSIQFDGLIICTHEKGFKNI
jgi:hypothetical protein